MLQEHSEIIYLLIENGGKCMKVGREANQIGGSYEDQFQDKLNLFLARNAIEMSCHPTISPIESSYQPALIKLLQNVFGVTPRVASVLAGPHPRRKR